MTNDQFLDLIDEYVKDRPELAPFVINRAYNAAARETQRRIMQANNRAADMEAALAMQIGRKKTVKDDVLNKLRIWKDKTTLDWGRFLGEDE